MGWEWGWEWERFFPYGDSHGDSHRIPMGMGWEWEWKFHSHGNRAGKTLYESFDGGANNKLINYNTRLQ